VLDVSSDLTQFGLFEQRNSLCRLVCHTHVHSSEQQRYVGTTMYGQSLINSFVAP
jgi:hypothetical protein